MKKADKEYCPICNHKLVKKHEGKACIYPGCPLRFKLGRGWVYLSRDRKDSLEFFRFKYNFDITRHNNLKKWLSIKSLKLYQEEKCQICGSVKFLHVHHILPRSTHPELTLDIENLMVLCEDCHFKIHENDKHKFKLTR